jgi:nitroreductase
MIRLSKIPGAVLRRLMAWRCLRWLFVSHLYRKPIAHSELIIVLIGKMKNLDESYWVGKVRQFAHVVDKGLHRGDFTNGHGVSAYQAAKGALARIQSQETLTDPLVQWASEKVCLYEQFQNGQAKRLQAEYVATECSYGNLIDAIKTRRSIRRFTEKPVEDEVIEKIASVLDWAPTSCHRQPGRVYASNNPDIVRQCLILHAGAGCFTDIYAPLLLSFCADSRLYRMPDELAIPFIDVSLGIQNCLLVAHSLGLSLTPLIWAYQGEWQERELREILSIPAHYQIILSAVGGYPDGGTQLPPRKRQELFIVK